MSSRLVPGRKPPPGQSSVADAIRSRRGERGLTPLDAVLLHSPPIAEGWSNLLGAVRGKGALPGEVRELMILRVGAVNGAAFEWIQHEIVGRTHGLTTAQLYIIRDTSTPLPPAKGLLTALQTAALRFADASTRDVHVSGAITDDLMRELREHVKKTNPNEGEALQTERVQDLFVEASAVVATYNMVSRFLVSTDVAGLSDEAVPWGIERKEHFIPIPSEADPTANSHVIHAITTIVSPAAPWIVFANGLLTNLTMWNYVIPFFIQSGYNVLVHSQRGHGKTTLPAASSTTRLTTIPSLAYDIAHLIHALHIKSPIHSIIGESQGGATTLAFSALPAFFPSASLPSPLPTTKSIIVCDSSARTAAGNKAAWESRISVVYNTDISFDNPSLSSTTLDDEFATRIGMSRLASITIPRWFPPGSPLSPSSPSGTPHRERAEWLSSLVKSTPPRGFVAGAQALADYDLLSESDPEMGIFGSAFNNTPGAPKVLLLAGALDGGGKIGQGLRNIAERWAKVREGVRYTEIEGLGHFPMVEQPEEWWKAVGGFLKDL